MNEEIIFNLRESVYGNVKQGVVDLIEIFWGNFLLRIILQRGGHFLKIILCI